MVVITTCNCCSTCIIVVSGGNGVMNEQYEVFMKSVLQYRYYFTEQEFNKKISNNLNFSLMHLNIRSLPLHFTELLCYLDTLDIEFKIIALSETAINSSHTSYTILSYHCEMNYRSMRKGGGVSLYIHSTLQYKLRQELQLGGEVNSVLLNYLNTPPTPNTM